MKITTNTILTVGSIAFAGFAAWYALKKSPAVLPQSGEQQRMSGVSDWLKQNQSQQQAVNTAAAYQYQSFDTGYTAPPGYYQ